MNNIKAKNPPVALEIGEGYASAVRVNQRAGRPALLEYTSTRLPWRQRESDSLWADFKLDERFQEGILELSDWIGRTRRLAVALPDTATKSFVLDLENETSSARELRDVLIFKIQKFAPISGENTALAWQKLRAAAGDGAAYLALIASRSLTASYERFFAARGTQVGCIESSSLAVLDLFLPRLRSSIDHGGNFAVVRIESGHFNVIVLNDFRLVFSRTRTVRAEEAMPAQIAQELKVLSLYVEDQLKGHGFDTAFCYGPGPALDETLVHLDQQGRDARRLCLADIMEIPGQLRARPTDEGRIVGAVALAARR